MNKQDLIGKLYDQFYVMGLNRVQLKMIVDKLFHSIIENVQNGETVKIQGFGSFTSKKRASREIYLPVKKQKVFVEEGVSIKFTPSTNFKK